jgi:hypothetical protein
MGADNSKASANAGSDQPVPKPASRRQSKHFADGFSPFPNIPKAVRTHFVLLYDPAFYEHVSRSLFYKKCAMLVRWKYIIRPLGMCNLAIMQVIIAIQIFFLLLDTTKVLRRSLKTCVCLGPIVFGVGHQNINCASRFDLVVALLLYNIFLGDDI